MLLSGAGTGQDWTGSTTLRRETGDERRVETGDRKRWSDFIIRKTLARETTTQLKFCRNNFVSLFLSFLLQAVCQKMYSYVKLELGTRQHCRENGTMFSGQKTVDDDIMSIFVVATLFRHRGFKNCPIFSRLSSSTTTLSRS